MSSDGGKGSAMRPAQISKAAFASNWDAIFSKKAPTPKMQLTAGAINPGTNETTWLPEAVAARQQQSDLFSFSAKSISSMLAGVVQQAAASACAQAGLAPDPDARWNVNDVQFARLLCEINATQEHLDVPTLAETMDLEESDVTELFERAHKVWEAAKRSF